VRGILVLFVLAVIAAGVVMAWPRMEGEAPLLTGPERIEISTETIEVELGWDDDQTGLRRVDAYLEFGSPDAAAEGGEHDAADRTPLHSKEYPGSSLSGPMRPVRSERVTVDLDAKAMEIPDGEWTLVVSARDWSWSDGWEGNASELRIPVIVDTQPPNVSVMSGLTYVRRGGSAIVVYRADADAVRSGVRVGEAWFYGRPTSGDERIAVFAVPIDAAENPQVEVVAIDAIGNEAKAFFDVRVQERQFPEITIALSESFLGRVATRLGESSGMSEATPLATFQRVNTELRERNEGIIAEAIDATATVPTQKSWTGAFEQMKNSSVTSKFAELRHYTSSHQRVSIARHYGFDLASTAHAPITASNAGTVIFAGDNGIYGTLVLIDHGLGITTLYGHLSNLSVQVGDKVEKGHALGRSGATGLAGGDHLHFAILVGKTYVDPVEWWDPKWVREHIEPRLGSESGE
jgi:murein DD-endopeptidase MepM/ murein hydrolase activator NlpD